mmetsp:Transcript_52395/g.59336  ORF Transcript_52395/g.59336 Transcript_52395/m.59336 type:complete len:88 (-) Transcript_52395:173-436(-)
MDRGSNGTMYWVVLVVRWPGARMSPPGFNARMGCKKTNTLYYNIIDTTTHPIYHHMHNYTTPDDRTTNNNNKYNTSRVSTEQRTGFI